LANIRKKIKRNSAKKPKFDNIVFSSKNDKQKSLPKAEKKKTSTEVIKMNPPKKVKESSENSFNFKDNIAEKFYNLKLLKNGKSFFHKKRLIAFMVCFALIITFLILIVATPTGLPEYLNNLFASITGGQGYPAHPEGGKILYTNTSNDVVFSLTDTNFIGTNKNGCEILSIQHGYENPSAVVSDARSLVYNYKNKKYLVTNYNSKVLSGELDNEILLGTICRNGNFALVTKSTGYESRVDVFNKKGKVIYSWFSANAPVSNLALSDNGKRLATVTVSASSGYIKSSVSILKFDSATPLFKYELDGVVLKLETYSNGFVAILSNKVVYYDWKKGEVNSKDISNNQLFFYKINEKNQSVLVCQKGIITNSYTITVSKKHEEKFSIDYNGVITDIDVHNNLIYILSNKKVSVINSKNEVVESYELDNLSHSLNVSKNGKIYTYNDTGVFKLN